MSIASGFISRHTISDPRNSRADLFSVIAKYSEKLTAGEGWPDGVDNLLKELGELLGVSRVWIFQIMKLTDTHIVQDYIFEWSAKPEYRQIGMSRFRMFTNRIGNDEYRNLLESRKRGEWQAVQASKLDSGFLKEDQIKQGIKSMLTVPLFIENQWWGTLGFDDCEREYDWGMEEISLLRIAATVISNAILNNKLKAKKEQFATLQSISDGSLWSLDLNSWHISITSGFLDIDQTPRQSDEFPLRDVLKMTHPEDRKFLLDSFRQGAKSGRYRIRYDTRIKAGEGQYRWVEVIGNAHFDTNGLPTLLAGIAIDIIDRKKEEEKLREAASVDPLTGVMNRRAFATRMEGLIREARDNSQPLSLLMIDIDHFKVVNDRWGHHVGDQVLIHMTAIINKMLRKKDFFARYGGEEFVVILPGVDKELSLQIGDRIRQSVAVSPCVLDEREVAFTISLGCASRNRNEDTSAKGLMLAADAALYQAKKNGRNQICC
ncbi:MAG: sensor domain-containing diguanylate cyclase [Sedimenticola sp.]|nr:MAG: sensor domain-containing diguanylate cyclase [Sedimenticola sp.]